MWIWGEIQVTWKKSASQEFKTTVPLLRNLSRWPQVIAASGIPENSLVQIVQVQSSTLWNRNLCVKMFSGRCSEECSVVRLYLIFIFIYLSEVTFFWVFHISFSVQSPPSPSNVHCEDTQQFQPIEKQERDIKLFPMWNFRNFGVCFVFF